MMDERFVTFEFSKPLPMAERKADWVHCAKCCAEFYLQGAAALDKAAAPAAAVGLAAGVAAPTLPLAGSPAVASVPVPGVAAATASAASPAAASPRASGTEAGLVSALLSVEALRQAGALSPEEFAAAKRQLLRMDFSIRRTAGD